jgi:hypothetical protein
MLGWSLATHHILPGSIYRRLSGASPPSLDSARMVRLVRDSHYYNLNRSPNSVTGVLPRTRISMG